MGGLSVRTLKINVNGKDYKVEIDDPNASPATVLVNGQAFEVTFTEQRAVAQAAQSPRQEAEPEVYVPTVASTYVATAVEPEEKAASPQPVAAAGGGAHEVTAPMPGKVLDIAVQVGAQVKHGETLCNLEAMKMKSPIRSTVDGTVAQILISEGQNVNFGDVLFTLQ
jgi:biotin carboxyl carrier protein